MPGPSGLYHWGAMARSRRRPCGWSKTPARWSILSAIFGLLLIAAPVVDLALNEPTLNESQGARCHLHANPAIRCAPTALAVALLAAPFLPPEPSDRLPLIGSSIFIPPRV